jgi:thioredoxin reductase (NADPH)
MGPDLMDQMRKQASRFGAQLVTDDITEMKLDSDVKVLADGSGNTIKSRAVILAMGSAYKEIGLKNEKRLSGRGVSWCATCDGFFFKEQVIAVVGGGDSAMEEANFLTKFAKKVVLIHRRDQLRASKIMAERAKANPKIEFLFNTEVIDVLGEDKVTGLKLRNVSTGEESSSDFTGLFVAIGHLPRSELVVGQVKTNSEGYVLVDSGSTRTNLPGVFASGDLVDFTYRQAITAAGSGCQAALDAERFLAGH